MDGAVVSVDHQLPIGPLRIFVSADQEFEGELFENVIVGGLEFVIGIQDLKDGGKSALPQSYGCYGWSVGTLRLASLDSEALSVTRSRQHRGSLR